jgi:serine/threonine-protein kinase HipA
MQAHLEIHLQGQWRECATLDVSAPAKGGAGAAVFAYDTHYAFSDTAPVSLNYPVNLDMHSLPHWPAFLFDLLPQGKGRRFLLGELGLADGQAADWPLLCAGAFNPVGRLRVREAAEFYQNHLARYHNPAALQGFTLDQILATDENFIEHLQNHSMLAAGTTGVQGVAPKFLLAQAHDGRWYADSALPDAQAQAHVLVKLARGADPSDHKILRNEAAYMRVAKALGLAVGALPTLIDAMLFIPRFDRRVNRHGVERLHQESMASLVGQIGFDLRPSQNAVLAALRQHVSDPQAATLEFIKRDVLNLAMGNTDNHARNSAVQIVENRVQLTPLFDFAPMYLDKEGIARALRWQDENQKELRNWADVLALLPLPEPEKIQLRQQLAAFGDELDKLEAMMAEQGVDDDIIQTRHQAVLAQREQLRELARPQSAPSPSPSPSQRPRTEPSHG